MPTGAASKRQQTAREAAYHNGPPQGPYRQGPPRFDGPNDSPSRGRAPSNAGSRSRGPSARGISREREAQLATARSLQPKEEAKKPTVLLRNVDFGGNAYSLKTQMPEKVMARQTFGKAGKVAKININSHVVKNWPTKEVFQYDIVIGSGAEKRGLIQKLWASNAVQAQIKDSAFIFDGNALGWALRQFPEKRILVDLDAEEGRAPRGERENKHRIVIRPASNVKVNLFHIKAFLDGQADFNEEVLQGINFLDHLLRETPSKHLINLRRSYFSRQGEPHERRLLGGGVEAMHGIYQSLRMAEGKRLVVNVDISNSCFWHERSFDMLAHFMSGAQTEMQFKAMCASKEPGREPQIMKSVRRLVKNKFKVMHRNSPHGDKVYTVMKIAHVNAKTHRFEVLKKETGKKEMKSVYEYYREKYNIALAKWELPLIDVQKKGILFPMELCFMEPGQRYPFKLNELQTAEMIKFAVSRPPVRREGIRKGMQLLNWAGDPMLKSYGLSIDSEMLKTNARILTPPEVIYAKNGVAKPGFSGRWDLRGKVFSKAGTPLKSWGVCSITSEQEQRPPPTENQIKDFVRNYIKLYRGHGGTVQNETPPIIRDVRNPPEALNDCFQTAGNQMKLRPQILLIILPNKSAELYQRVKRNCDVRFGVMSQCVQASNLIKNQPQYISNVLMKFNCKLGGTTSTVKGRGPYIQEPTMIIGADVSHPAPGLEQASMAAFTVSIDRTCSRYGAAIESNGSRREMISADNIRGMLGPFIDWWMKNVGEGHPPRHVYYFRDGVSEGQFQPLLHEEVADIKNVFDKLGGGDPRNMPKFTVIVAEKRHHIRFFPPQGPDGDKNGNPLPGTVVDHDVTHPTENDMYLCSHVAIQGTARPTHYYTILDEANVPVDKLEGLIYDHCYHYQRATTPVSLFPAVYYAHLAAKRGESHIDMAATEKARITQERLKHPGKEDKSHSDEMRKLAEWPKLQPFEPKNQMGYGMWYI